MSETSTKRYHVKAQKRIGAQPDLPGWIDFVVEDQGHKDAWENSRKMCARGATVTGYDPDTGSERASFGIVPGQYTVRHVYTLDKPRAASKPNDVQLVDFLARAAHQGVTVKRDLDNIAKIMWQEMGLDPQEQLKKVTERTNAIEQELEEAAGDQAEAGEEIERAEAVG